MRCDRSVNRSVNRSARLTKRTITPRTPVSNDSMVGGRGFYPPPKDDQSGSGGNRSVNRLVVSNPPMKVIVRLGVPLEESER